MAQSQDGSGHPEAAPEDGVIKRRRRSDWNGRPRDDGTGSPSYTAGVEVAAAALAAHDSDTGRHSDDVVEVSEAIAERLALTGPDREHLSAAAQLHDLGKVAIPPEVLRKPGPLTEEEWEVVRRHTLEGERILAAVPEMGGVARIVRHSHERFDGKGYPDGLAADEIPLAARIVFCADAFHAMRCDRPYRPGRPASEALAEIEANAGTQFDPAVAAALCEVAAEIRRHRARFLANASRRRLAVLLLTLVVGGSAFAATGAWRDLPYAGGDAADAAAPCAPCMPAALGRLGTLPAPVAVTTATTRRKASAPRGSGAGSQLAGPGRAAAPGGSPGSGPRVTSRGKSEQTPRAPRPAARRAPPSDAGAPAGRAPATVREQSPGRSGEAPRRPELPVRLDGGAGGRSNEAPGKPVPLPGKFGQLLP